MEQDIKISGSNNSNVGNRQETVNYNGLNIEDLVKMMEERFRHMLQKEEDIRAIFDENRKLTDEIIRQNDEFRKKNDDHRELLRYVKELLKRIEILEKQNE